MTGGAETQATQIAQTQTQTQRKKGRPSARGLEAIEEEEEEEDEEDEEGEGGENIAGGSRSQAAKRGGFSSAVHNTQAC